MQLELLFSWYAIGIIFTLCLIGFTVFAFQIKKKQFPEEKQAVKKNIRLLGIVLAVYVVMTIIVMVSGAFKA